MNKRKWLALSFLLVMGFALIMGPHWFYIGFNFTESIPGAVFVVVKGSTPKKGDYAAFYAPHNGRYKPSTLFVKKVVGIAGDHVSLKNGIFYVNNNRVGAWQLTDIKGRLLHAGPTGELPEQTIFVAGTHERSFDSRYQEMGWISLSYVLGRAYLLL